MKIIVAILANENYLLKITNAFIQKYSDLEVRAFSNGEVALKNMRSEKIDLFIVENSFDIDLSSISDRCAIAYFVDKQGIAKYKEKPTIFMFQRVGDIYNQIVSIYSENMSDVSIRRSESRNSKILLFSSPCGGVGTSSLACACAITAARTGFRTLYLNFEKFPSTNIFFVGEGTFNIREIIRALQNENRAVLPLKLQSSVKRSADGVFFYSEPENVLDMTEISVDEMIEVIRQVSSLDQNPYNYIIIDMNFSLEEEYLKLFQEVDSVIMASDGSMIANSKICQAYKSLETLENDGAISVLSKLNIIYNIFGSKTGKHVEGVDIKELGGIQRFANATVSQIISGIIEKGIFAKLL